MNKQQQPLSTILFTLVSMSYTTWKVVSSLTLMPTPPTFRIFPLSDLLLICRHQSVPRLQLPVSCCNRFSSLHRDSISSSFYQIIPITVLRFSFLGSHLLHNFFTLLPFRLSFPSTNVGKRNIIELLQRVLRLG